MNDKGVIKRYVVTPDKHFPYADRKAIKTLCKAIEILKPDGYIDLGDTGEWESCSHWRWKNRAKPSLEWYLPEIITDIDDVNKGMDIIDESLDKANVKEKHFCEGNHELWMTQFTEAYPFLKNEYNIPSALRLKDRGYQFYNAGDRLKIGKLNFYHGHLYGGQHHCANHLRRYGESIMYGHWHDLQTYTSTSGDGPITAWSIGCLKELSGESIAFTRGRPINWSHAFAIVDYVGKDDFFVNVVEIKNGRAVILGEVVQS